MNHKWDSIARVSLWAIVAGEQSKFWFTLYTGVTLDEIEDIVYEL